LLLHLWLLLCLLSLLSFRRGPTPPQCPDAHYPQPNGSPDCSLHDLQLECLPAASYNVFTLPRHISCLLLHPLMP
jgi:hypothetical protein